MNNGVIEHSGIIQRIERGKVYVLIEQKSACSSCSANKYCSSSEKTNKIIDVECVDAERYNVGDRVNVVATLSMGRKAVLLAFIVPFLILIVSLFGLMAFTNDEIVSGLLSILFLVPYYIYLWFKRYTMKKSFVFTLKAI
ncbi:MAG: SoxR reducing system RseC family protein [Bacteroides sp.]|nr:SoxR reducing system RseC family protein [Bacteroides sp.]